MQLYSKNEEGNYFLNNSVIDIDQLMFCDDRSCEKIYLCANEEGAVKFESAQYLNNSTCPNRITSFCRLSEFFFKTRSIIIPAKVEFIEKPLFNFSTTFRLEYNLFYDGSVSKIILFSKDFGVSMFESFHDSIKFEFLRKRPKEMNKKFYLEGEIVEDENGKVLDDRSIKLFKYLFSDDFQKNGFIVYKCHYYETKEKQYHEETMIEYCHKSFVHLEANKYLPKKGAKDLRYNILRQSEYYFIHPKTFLKSSYTLLKKIEKKVLGSSQDQSATKKIKYFDNKNNNNNRRSRNKNRQFHSYSFDVVSNPIIKNVFNVLKNNKNCYKPKYGRLDPELLTSFVLMITNAALHEGDYEFAYKIQTRAEFWTIRFFSTLKTLEKSAQIFLERDNNLGDFQYLANSLAKGGFILENIQKNIPEIPRIKKDAIEGKIEVTEHMSRVSVTSDSIREILEYFYIISLVEGFEIGMKHIFTFLFSTKIAVLYCFGNDFCTGFYSYKRFGVVRDPFYSSSIEEKRVYDILVSSFLRKTKLVFNFISNNEFVGKFISFLAEKQDQPGFSKERFCVLIYKLLISRGEIELALEYNLFILSLISKKFENEKDSEKRQLLVFDLINNSLERMKQIVRLEMCSRKSYKEVSRIFRNIYKIAKKNGGLSNFISFSRFLENNNNNNLELIRMKCFFCSSVSIVLGFSNNNNNDDKNNIKKFLEDKKKTIETIKISEKHSDLIETMYFLAVQTFIHNDLGRFKIWIEILSDLEFFADSYKFSKKYHHLYQKITNIYYFNRKNNMIHKIEPSKNEKKIFIIGDEQIFPWASQRIQMKDGGMGRLVPIFYDGLSIERDILVPNSCFYETLKKFVIEESKNKIKNVRMVFFVGEKDLRRRILNLKGIGINLLNFSEDYQIHILCNSYIKLIQRLEKEFSEILKICIMPVFPFLDVFEESRIYKELSEHRNVFCKNRVRLFNRLLSTKIKELNNKNLFFMDGIQSVVYNSNENKIKKKFDLGYVNMIKVNEYLLDYFSNRLLKNFDPAVKSPRKRIKNKQ